jgi:chromosome partitioning protein
LARRTRQDAAVTDSDDVASRGRAIFQRLRAAPAAAPPPTDEDEPDTTAAPDTADVTASATPEADPGAGLPEPTAPAGADDGGDPAGQPAEVAEPAASVSAPDPAAGPARSPLPGAQDLAVLDELRGRAAPSQIATDADVEALTEPAVAAAAESAAAVATEVGEPSAAAEDAVADDHFARPLPRVMAVANQKGGVGKTTTAVNLGACLADIGYRVLVVDLDPQGNASTGLGINIRDLQGSMYDVILHDLPIEDCVEATSVRNLFCAPSSLDLAGAEIELVPAFSRELRLKRALEEVRDDYDFVLIDCPPSLGLLTINGLAAASEVVVPIQCEYYALEGLGQLLRNVNLVQRNLNPALELSAIILVMYDARTKLADQVVTEVREHFGATVCRNVVPRTVRLSEAPSFGQPIIAFDSSSRGAIAYRELAKEVSGGTPQRAR